MPVQVKEYQQPLLAMAREGAFVEGNIVTIFSNIGALISVVLIAAETVRACPEQLWKFHSMLLAELNGAGVGVRPVQSESESERERICPQILDTEGVALAFLKWMVR